LPLSSCPSIDENAFLKLLRRPRTGSIPIIPEAIPPRPVTVSVPRAAIASQGGAPSPLALGIAPEAAIRAAGSTASAFQRNGRRRREPAPKPLLCAELGRSRRPRSRARSPNAQARGRRVPRRPIRRPTIPALQATSTSSHRSSRARRPVRAPCGPGRRGACCRSKTAADRPPSSAMDASRCQSSSAASGAANRSFRGARTVVTLRLPCPSRSSPLFQAAEDKA
jgi:hypothetical protein